MEHIPKKDKIHLRALAKRKREISELPVMEKRTARWYRHNQVMPGEPMVVIELLSFADDLIPKLKCSVPETRFLERNLLLDIVNHELVDDDKVVTPDLEIPMKIKAAEYGIDINRKSVVDSTGRHLGYADEHPVKDLNNDLEIIKPASFTYDRNSTENLTALACECIGDILEVKVKNNSLRWHMALTAKAVKLMGMENFFMALAADPEGINQLLGFLRNDIISFLDWLEEKNLLTLNNGNDYAGAGSYGFTRELPVTKDAEEGNIRIRDLWANLNSQETVGVSPDMYKEFIYPYYRDLAERFGLVYYGCCEPVHTVWDGCLENLPNLRKVSISPWCDERMMGERLKGSRVIYSRKPSPNLIGVGSFQEDTFKSHIKETLEATRGCTVEFIYRDVYTLSGDLEKPKKAVQIIRELAK